MPTPLYEDRPILSSTTIAASADYLPVRRSGDNITRDERYAKITPEQLVIGGSQKEVYYVPDREALDFPDHLKRFGTIVRETGTPAIFVINTPDDIDPDSISAGSANGTYFALSIPETIVRYGVWLNYDNTGTEPTLDDGTNWYAINLPATPTIVEIRDAIVSGLTNHVGEAYTATINDTTKNIEIVSQYNGDLTFPLYSWPFNVIDELSNDGVTESDMLWMLTNPSEWTNYDSWNLIGPFSESLSIIGGMSEFGASILTLDNPDLTDDIGFVVVENPGSENYDIYSGNEVRNQLMGNVGTFTLSGDTITLDDPVGRDYVYVFNFETTQDGLVIMLPNSPRDHQLTTFYNQGAPITNLRWDNVAEPIHGIFPDTLLETEAVSVIYANGYKVKSNNIGKRRQDEVHQVEWHLSLDLPTELKQFGTIVRDEGLQAKFTFAIGDELDPIEPSSLIGAYVIFYRSPGSDPSPFGIWFSVDGSGTQPEGDVNYWTEIQLGANPTASEIRSALVNLNVNDDLLNEYTVTNDGSNIIFSSTTRTTIDFPYIGSWPFSMVDELSFPGVVQTDTLWMLTYPPITTDEGSWTAIGPISENLCNIGVTQHGASILELDDPELIGGTGFLCTNSDNGNPTWISETNTRSILLGQSGVVGFEEIDRICTLEPLTSEKDCCYIFNFGAAEDGVTIILPTFQRDHQMLTFYNQGQDLTNIQWDGSAVSITDGLPSAILQYESITLINSNGYKLKSNNFGKRRQGDMIFTPDKNGPEFPLHLRQFGTIAIDTGGVPYTTWEFHENYMPADIFDLDGTYFTLPINNGDPILLWISINGLGTQPDIGVPVSQSVELIISETATVGDIRDVILNAYLNGEYTSTQGTGDLVSRITFTYNTISELQFPGYASTPFQWAYTDSYSGKLGSDTIWMLAYPEDSEWIPIGPLSENLITASVQAYGSKILELGDPNYTDGEPGFLVTQTPSVGGVQWSSANSVRDALLMVSNSYSVDGANITFTETRQDMVVRLNVSQSGPADSLTFILPNDPRFGQRFTLLNTGFDITNITWAGSGYNCFNLPTTIEAGATLTIIYCGDYFGESYYKAP